MIPNRTVNAPAQMATPPRLVIPSLSNCVTMYAPMAMYMIPYPTSPIMKPKKAGNVRNRKIVGSSSLYFGRLTAWTSTSNGFAGPVLS